MDNPNNITEKHTHQLQFISGDAFSIETFTLMDDSGKPYAESHNPIDIDPTTCLKMYNTMRFIRLLDERMLAAQRQGRISFYMQCTGEEAAVTASTAALKDDDMIMAQYREQAALHYRDFSLEEFMNQLFSNEKDLGKGRQMPIHYGKAAINYLTISSPLATQIPQASGYAYGQKIRGTKSCTLCYFGEGAASEGDFHAGLNMAAVHRTPVIFFCRNNGYAISTFADEQFSGNGIASRGTGYGIRSIRVDGRDTLAVYAATKAAREYVISQNKPCLIEALVYRSAAHSSSDDPSGYRTKEEEEHFLKFDPIQRFRSWLVMQGWLDPAEDEKVTTHTKEAILAALKKAEKINKPCLKEMFSDVYDEPPEHLQQQFFELKSHIMKYKEAYPHTGEDLE